MRNGRNNKDSWTVGNEAGADSAGFGKASVQECGKGCDEEEGGKRKLLEYIFIPIFPQIFFFVCWRVGNIGCGDCW